MNHDFLSSLASSRTIPARILDLPSAWTGHIPFAHWLGATLQPKQFVELGTHFGHSYFNFCEGIKSGKEPGACFAVDTWEGDEHAGKFANDLYDRVRDFNQAHYADISTLLRMTFDEALEQIPDASLDLLHIDGYHTYGAVKHDFESWRPKLQKHAVVLFHDTQVKDHNFGVWKLWRELCAEHELTFEFTHFFGLGVLQLQPREDSVLPEFWRAVQHSPEWVRDYFRQQGNRVAERSAIFRQLKDEGKPLPAEFHHEVLAKSSDPDQAVLEVIQSIYDCKEPDAKLEDRIKVLNEKLLEERDLSSAAKRRLEALAGLVDKKEQALHESDYQVHQLASQLQHRNGVYSDLAANSHAFILHSYRNCESSFYPCFQLLHKLETYFPRPALLLSTPCKLLGWCMSGRLMRNLKRYRDAKLILESGFFEPVWYLENNQDVFFAGEHPLNHWLRIGWKEGRLPNPDMDVLAYQKKYPDVAASQLNPLVHYIRIGRGEKRCLPKPETNLIPKSELDISLIPKLPKVSELIRMRFPGERPLPVYYVDSRQPCLNLVTDSINAGSLFGGVGTAILLGVETANRLQIPLRILTLTEAPQSENLGILLETHSLEMTQPVFFDHLSGPHRSVPVHPADLYLSTSWWSTQRLLYTVAIKQILYLLQEDERMFYPHGDDWLRCHEVLSHPELKILVNSQNLYDHLCQQGCDNLLQNGVYFEPAFPHGTNRRKPKPVGTKKKFFFYARPHHDRNVFYRGLEVVHEAMSRGILSPEEWEIYFAGHHIPDLMLPGGVKPKVLANLSWKAYCEEVSDMDLGLSLMLSPHSSYPPLDLAAAGIYVVTNQFGIKKDLSSYSNHILCVPAGKEQLLEGLREAVQLLKKEPARPAENATTLPHDWREAFTPVVQWIEERT
ncbi:MAG: class I SAM-dependent methyltransferase [Opitutales bacterium]